MKKIFVFIVLLVNLEWLSAQVAPVPIQLTELINKALDNYPSLKEANEYVSLSEVKKDLAYGAYMPVITADASYRYGKPTPSISFPIGQGITKEIQFIPANNYDLGLKIQQPIWDFGRTGANIQKSKSEIITSKDDLENTNFFQVLLSLFLNPAKRMESTAHF